MFEKMKSELEAAMQAHNVPFASFGATNAHATRLHAHIGSAGSSALDDTHIFRIASMTKPIVTLAALQLVARGDLRLDQPMKEIVPELGEVQVVSRNGDEFAYAPLARDITLHHLLTHTSGFAYDFHHRLRRGAADALAGIDANVQRNAARLPVILDMRATSMWKMMPIFNDFSINS